jgi:hypothetical protein
MAVAVLLCALLTALPVRAQERRSGIIGEGRIGYVEVGEAHGVCGDAYFVWGVGAMTSGPIYARANIDRFSGWWGDCPGKIGGRADFSTRVAAHVGRRWSQGRLGIELDAGAGYYFMPDFWLGGAVAVDVVAAELARRLGFFVRAEAGFDILRAESQVQGGGRFRSPQTAISAGLRF